MDHLILTDWRFEKSERLYAVGYRLGNCTLGAEAYYDEVAASAIMDEGRVVYIGELPRGGSNGASGTILVKNAAVRGHDDQGGCRLHVPANLPGLADLYNLSSLTQPLQGTSSDLTYLTHLCTHSIENESSFRSPKCAKGIWLHFLRKFINQIQWR